MALTVYTSLGSLGKFDKSKREGRRIRLIRANKIIRATLHLAVCCGLKGLSENETLGGYSSRHLTPLFLEPAAGRLAFMHSSIELENLC